jgi:GNAT superfamily N-acetyltransferase
LRFCSRKVEVMTNQQILNIALQQSSFDSNCKPEDFLASENKIVFSKPHPMARRYLQLPFFCDLTSYGSNIVASVSPEIAEDVRCYLDKYSVAHCFETPNLQVLNEALKQHKYAVCFMAEYFLPDVDILQPISCRYPTRILLPKDLQNLYQPQWENALCEKRKELDCLAVGAYDGEKLIGLAGCSADCDTMWQIGIDVLPEYRRQGIASALTSQLAYEILARDKVPFYCCAWSNLASVRNAIHSGFRPAWVQVTAKSCEFVDLLNQ